MNAEGFERKLTAILSADVAGYSRLMGEDDEATVRTLKGHREMMSAIIRKHKGRVVDSPGDNLLAEFGSALQSVECAVEIQRELTERNADLPEGRRMEYRIGVNLGDVIEEGERIYGDGVNIAARLEALAQPGGICISGYVYNQVKNRLQLEYHFKGEQTVKNIKEPVPVYCIHSFAGDLAAEKNFNHRKKTWRKKIMVPVAALVVLAAAFSVWRLYFAGPSMESGAVEKTVIPLADRPSIAVLPFVNISGDPEQEYFSDGMTEELINALSKLEGLKVISRTSAFHFKGKDLDLRTIGAELGVEHVLEGSVRKSGNQLRVTAQLIKVADDTHLWSETYDREMQAVFAIQDEISRMVVNNITIKLIGNKGKSYVQISTGNMEAYNLYLKGRYYYNLYTVDTLKKALECYRKCIEIDPLYAPAYAGMAYLYLTTLTILPQLRSERYAQAFYAVNKALELDNDLAEAQACLGLFNLTFNWDWKTAERCFQKALQLNPGSADVIAMYSDVLQSMGRLDEALIRSGMAVKIDPFSRYANVYYAFSLTFSKQYDRAILQAKHILEMFPKDPGPHLVMGTYYVGQRMFSEAVLNYQNAVIKYPANWILLGNLAFAYAMDGQKDEARKILNKMLDASRTGDVPITPIAKIYMALGDIDNAFDCLGKAIENKEISGLKYIKVMQDFDNLRSDPRFDALLKKMGFTD